MNNYEVMLAGGEVTVKMEKFGQGVKNVWGGQVLEYKYFLSFLDGAFDNIELIVHASVTNEPYVELEFHHAELADKESGDVEMFEELMERHEFLDGLSQSFQRSGFQGLSLNT